MRKAPLHPFFTKPDWLRSVILIVGLTAAFLLWFWNTWVAAIAAILVVLVDLVLWLRRGRASETPDELRKLR